MTSKLEILRGLTIEDSVVGPSLRIGLSTYEIYFHYRAVIYPQTKIPLSSFHEFIARIDKRSTKDVFSKIGGKYRHVIAGSGRKKPLHVLNPPGLYIYYTDFAGLARFIFELRSAEEVHGGSCVGILEHMNKKGRPLTRTEMPRRLYQAVHRNNVRKLTDMGLVQFKDGTYEPTELSKNILSLETEEIWKSMTQQTFFRKILK
jgi:hypothetical protein